MSDLEQVSESMAAAVARGGASVARVDGRCSSSSAVVFGGEGWLVTAAHALEGRESVEVALGDGRTLPAKVLGRDRGTDRTPRQASGRFCFSPRSSFAG